MDSVLFLLPIAALFMLGMVRRTPEDVLRGQGLSHKAQIMLAFFLGGAISSIAQDPSDTLFFLANSAGALTVEQATLYWYVVPFMIYFSFFLVGYLLAKFTPMPPTFIIYIFLITVVGSTLVSLMLPQHNFLTYVVLVSLGFVISIGTILGLLQKVK